MKVLSWVSTLLEKWMGEDKYAAAGMLVSSARTREAPGHVWVDYLFLAACYYAAAGDEKNKNLLVTKIKEVFPNYCPSTRFSASAALELGFEVGKYILPACGQMNKFCDTHPEFSFGDAFGEDFPQTKNMHIKTDTAPGVLKEQDGRYSINDNLAVE